MLAIHRPFSHRVSLVAGLVLLGFVAGVRADDVSEGEAIVKGRCLMCHNHDRLVRLAIRTPAEEREARWTRFLPSHNMPRAEERPLVIAYLLAVTAGK